MRRTLIITIDTDIPDGLYPEVLLEPGTLIDAVIDDSGVVGRIVAMRAVPAVAADGVYAWLRQAAERGIEAGQAL